MKETYQNINMAGLGIYYPNNKVDNSFFIEHFAKMGIQVDHLLKSLGKEERYLDDTGEETVISMGYKAAVLAMEKANVKPEEIDMLIFATDSPEYTCPSNALYINGLLGTVNAHISFDINTNCTGMITAFDVASRLMDKNYFVNKALIIGGLLSSLIASNIDPVVYSIFSDSGAAIVLEKKNEDIKRGFIDSGYKTDPFCKQNFVMPKAGFSQMYNPNVDIEDKKFRLDPFDTSFVPGEWVKLINTMLERNNLSAENINHFLFSQFSKPFTEQTLKAFGLSNDRQTYVGDKYGYTGVTSPFISLHEAMETDRVKEGDYLVFVSVGAGYNVVSLLYKM